MSFAAPRPSELPRDADAAADWHSGHSSSCRWVGSASLSKGRSSRARRASLNARGVRQPGLDARSRSARSVAQPESCSSLPRAHQSTGREGPVRAPGGGPSRSRAAAQRKTRPDSEPVTGPSERSPGRSVGVVCCQPGVAGWPRRCGPSRSSGVLRRVPSYNRELGFGQPNGRREGNVFGRSRPLRIKLMRCLMSSMER